MRITKFFVAPLIAISVAFSTATYGFGIPVFDAAADALAIVDALATVVDAGATVVDASQTVIEIQHLYDQLVQQTKLATGLDGARALGTFLGNSTILAALPPEMANSAAMLSSTLSASDAAHVTSVLNSFGVPAAVGDSSAVLITKMSDVMASAVLRDGQVQALAARVDSSPDAKDAMDLLNRNVLESVDAINQMTKTIALVESSREAARLRAIAADVSAAGNFRAQLIASR